MRPALSASLPPLLSFSSALALQPPSSSSPPPDARELQLHPHLVPLCTNTIHDSITFRRASAPCTPPHTPY
ncbi:uncharacterized protein LAESUDRAFT_731006 [Laetiporus sulphureus 93-53]|uniref:Secreted protein n=1 Tax=Laetiporus sulphureus 93-53 TaxID=1314785 RepID=A0A165BT18_9APHY|nr:uncharacterized protein LAESUDRAFT_731006 [Laetiporus sulphureus 93-53]KZT01596.1 hypothetical protein LAESUDRAFT_731006 [Laetiporus sulphureus 93-53]